MMVASDLGPAVARPAASRLAARLRCTVSSARPRLRQNYVVLPGRRLATGPRLLGRRAPGLALWLVAPGRARCLRPRHSCEGTWPARRSAARVGPVMPGRRLLAAGPRGRAGPAGPAWQQVCGRLRLAAAAAVFAVSWLTASAAPSALTKSRQVGYRLAGDLAIAVAMTWSTAGGRSGRRSVSRGGSASSCAHISAMLSSRRNGGVPVASRRPCRLARTGRPARRLAGPGSARARRSQACP